MVVFWTSPTHACDTNGDGIIAPMDALMIINHLNARGAHKLVVPPSADEMPPPFLDVNADGSVSPFDALVTINYLNKHGLGLVDRSGGEGEATYISLMPGATWDRVPWTDTMERLFSDSRVARLWGTSHGTCTRAGLWP